MLWKGVSNPTWESWEWPTAITTTLTGTGTGTAGVTLYARLNTLAPEYPPLSQGPVISAILLEWASEYQTDKLWNITNLNSHMNGLIGIDWSLESEEKLEKNPGRGAKSLKK